MRILFVSETGLNLGLAMRCENDGHDVRYIDKHNCGIGIIKTPSEKESSWADMTIFDTNSFAGRADEMRIGGHKILGPSRWSSMLAHDGVYKSQIIASLGFPNNNLQQGTNFYISAWFNGATFISTYASFVYRRFMSGGAGPDLNCTGMLGNFNGVTSKTWRTFVEPLEKMLKKVNHRGPVHIHAIVQGDQFSVKDINASFMHPLSLLLYENSSKTPSTILLALFDETSKPIKPIDSWASGLQLSVTPYPHGDLKEDRFIQTQGIVQANMNHIWLGNISKKDGQYYAHANGLVGYVCARGINEHECVRRMYRTVSNLKVADLQYRNDVGRNIQNMITSLTHPGWLS